MPLLNSKFLSNWYTISVPNQTKPVLVESFTQTKIQDASNKGMIQGDIGVRVMDVGTLYYSSSLSGPIIVPGSDALNNPINDFVDLFNLITDNVAYQKNGVVGNDISTLLLKSAQIQVTTEQVRATANFEGDFELASTTYNGEVLDDINLLARTARFYDTYFYLGNITNPSVIVQGVNTFPVISGDININFDLDKNFFLGQGQAPYFSIRGYNATGNVKVALKPSQYTYLTTQIIGSNQASGILNYNAGNIGVQIANFNLNKILNLGTAFVITKIEFSMQQNSIITATIEFNAFFNSDSKIYSFSNV